MSSKGTYSSIPKEENAGGDVEKVYQHPKSRASVLKRCLFTLAYIVVTLLAAYGFITLVKTDFFKQRLSCNCGDTIEDAQKNGCVYDSLAAAWLPPHCRSEALTADFESLGPNPPDVWGNTWPYWADANKTKPLTLGEVSRLPTAAAGEPSHFFATHQWHVVHCVFYWRKMWDSSRRAEGLPGTAGEVGPLLIEKRYDTLMHISHCMQMFLKRDPLDTIATEAGVALHSDVIHFSKPHEHEHQGSGQY